jgi:hypothetical protein
MIPIAAQRPLTQWSQEILQMLLDHPLAPRIPANGLYSLAEASLEVARNGRVELLNFLFSHPGARCILVNGPMGEPSLARGV